MLTICLWSMYKLFTIGRDKPKKKELYPYYNELKNRSFKFLDERNVLVKRRAVEPEEHIGIGRLITFLMAHNDWKKDGKSKRNDENASKYTSEGPKPEKKREQEAPHSGKRAAAQKKKALDEENVSKQTHGKYLDAYQMVEDLLKEKQVDHDIPYDSDDSKWKTFLWSTENDDDDYDPVPDEYRLSNSVLVDKSESVKGRDSQAHGLPSIASSIELTRDALELYTPLYGESPNDVVIPDGLPYEFMKNSSHPPLEGGMLDHVGLNIDCPDGCVDCEVWPFVVSQSKKAVQHWFEHHFKPEDVQVAAPEPPYPIASSFFFNLGNDEADVSYVDELYGATDCDQFYRFKALRNTPEPDDMTVADRVMWNMMRGEAISLPYYHGNDYNAIVAYYEPRYIPNDHTWPYDESRPIWEARGLVRPGQDERSRWKCIREEYDRQWVLYGRQDHARQFYIASIMKSARDQFDRN